MTITVIFLAFGWYKRSSLGDAAQSAADSRPGRTRVGRENHVVLHSATEPWSARLHRRPRDHCQRAQLGELCLVGAGYLRPCNRGREGSNEANKGKEGQCGHRVGKDTFTKRLHS